MDALIRPLARAAGQLGERAFLGVLVRSLAWSAGCFVALHFLALWCVRQVLGGHVMLGWAAGILAAFGASVLALWLFLPLAAAIGTLYIDRVAAAVERRWYPSLPQAHGASLPVQIWDGINLGSRVLLLNILALISALILPGIGLLLAWAIAAYAIGRGLFVAVAMRRLSRPAAELLYHRVRGIVLAHGAIMALAAYVPVLNLLIPVLGTAVMVHDLDIALTQAPPGVSP